jgi:MFS family permease
MVAAYAVGSLVATLPAGILAGRIGYRAAVIAGLILMAASSLLFGLAGDVLALEASRFGQGVASAVCWAAGLGWVSQASPPEQRGRTLGIVMGATVAGSLAGPAIGALAAGGDRAPAFIAVAAAASVLAVCALAVPSTPAVRTRLVVLLRSVRRSSLAVPLGLFLLAAFLIAGLATVAPLDLASVGWSAAGIGAISIAGALVQMASNPLLGRWSDRRSRLAPVFAVLGISAGVAALLATPLGETSAALGALLLCANVAFAGFYVPASALLADAADAAGIDQSSAFALANLAWSPGTVAGSLVAGALAGAAGDEAAYALLAAVCFAVLCGALSLRRVSGRSAGAPPDRARRRVPERSEP